MSLVDPTGGIGYPFGAVFPSAHASAVVKQQPNALDATLGGSWTMAGNATIAGAGELRLNHLRLSAGGSSTFDHAPTLSGALNLQLASRSIVRVHSLRVSDVDTATRWQGTATGTLLNTPSAGSCLIDLQRLTNGSTLDTVLVRYKGTGHAAFPGGAPGTMPLVTVYRYDQDGAASSLGSASDTSGTEAIYDAAHTIAVAGLATVIDLTQYRYAVSIASESGANYQAGAIVSCLKSSCTVTAYSEQ